jgi:hypothetical protein
MMSKGPVPIGAFSMSEVAYNSSGGLLDTAHDIYNLQRFINAQESTFDVVQAELAVGQKRSHWMWFSNGSLPILKILIPCSAKLWLIESNTGRIITTLKKGGKLLVDLPLLSQFLHQTPQTRPQRPEHLS